MVFEVTEAEKQIFKNKVKFLKKFNGKGTELISVYIPSGTDRSSLMTQLTQEISQSSNIKSPQTRKNVQGALRKVINYLKTTDFKLPKQGIVIFSGNISEREGASNIKLFIIKPIKKLTVKLYWCDSKFHTQPLEEMIEPSEYYAIVVMDKREATLALVTGKKYEIITKLTSGVPGKIRAGGQCLKPNTLIQLSDGNIIKISECHNLMKVKSSDFKSKLLDSRITNKRHTIKNQIKISTKNPKTQIICSEDHKFFVLNEKLEEKKAKELKKGNKLLIPKEIKVKGKNYFFDKTKNENEYYTWELKKQGRELLKKKRIEKKLKQKDLAKKLKLTQRTISCIELGKFNPSKSNITKLCKEFSINFNKFKKNHLKKKTSKRLPKELNKELAQLVGYTLGNGCIEKDKLNYYERDLETIKKYNKLIKKLFNVKGTIKSKKRKNYNELRVYRKEMTSFILNEFNEITKKRESTIPKKILMSKNNVLAGFLRGLFDAKGHLSKSYLSIRMDNEILIKQLQLALLRFGIISSTHNYDNKKNPYSNNVRWNIQINEKESIEKFKKAIKFSNSKKKKKLEELINNKKNVNRSKEIVIHSKISKIEKINKKIKMVDISVENENFIANGLIVHNSSNRFRRLREEAEQEFYKRISERMNAAFVKYEDKLNGLIIGGPGMTKQELINKNLIDYRLKEKLMNLVDVSYTDEAGIREVLQKSEELLKESEIIKEKKVLNKFLGEIIKENGLATYGFKEVMEALEAGRIELLLISEELSLKIYKFKCTSCNKTFEKITKEEINVSKEKCNECNSTVELIEENNLNEHLIEKAKEFKTEVKFISTESNEGMQFLKTFSGIGAILRY